MKKCCFLFPLLLINFIAFAQTKSEALQVGAILESLQTGNSGTYLSLFPSYDSLLKTLHATTDTAAMITFNTDPRKLQQYDPVYNPAIDSDFKAVFKKGKDSTLHWSDILLSRYELEKMMITRDMRGIDKIIKVRLQGYIMVEDALTRKHYIIAVKDIMGMNGLWYGGHVTNVLEAETIDEYYDKLAAERKMEKQKLMALLYPNEDVDTSNTSTTPVAAAPKSILAISTDDDEAEAEKKKPKGPKDVSARKFYTGTFDYQTKVELYMRGLKGSCPDTVCYWEAIYRFQDQDEYIKLEVTRKADGTFIFDEEPDVGNMELSIKEDRLVGTWISNKDKTEYEVNLKEKKEVKGSKLEEMDGVIENGVFAN
ncbi:MAG: hypothetical protein EOP51_02995 [Sphingobacteriales bacterium]|nr:MAG: hypothetical protein EOP51_02995 [Sphingobacteriales bacterium]